MLGLLGNEWRVKVAIVGSGIAGLAASHYLSQQGHRVHLYESQPQIGMAAQTIELPTDDHSGMVTGDVPSRMFNAGLWPRVDRLYRSLGLQFINVRAHQSYRIDQQTFPLSLEMPFQFADEVLNPANAVANVRSAIGSISRSLIKPRKPSRSNVTDSASPLSPASDSQRQRDLGRRRSDFLFEIRRLRDQGNSDLATLDRELSFVDYLDRHHFSAEFRGAFLYPALSSTVCTCSHAAIENYPAIVLLDAMQHISGNRRLSRVVGGTRSVAQRLVDGVERVFLNSPVQRIEPTQHTTAPDTNDRSGSVSLTVGGTAQHYDHIVIASQSNHVANLFPQVSNEERAILEGFQYEDVEVVVHSDTRLMPPDQSDWAAFNFVTANDYSESMCTVWMNQFHCDWQQNQMERPIFQTIRPIETVRPDAVLSRIMLQRPIVDSDSWKRWEALKMLNVRPDRKIWFCGSYATPGIPLLESAVASAMEINDAISHLSR